MRTLVAGAWLGEFGWELCTWIPYVRAIAPDYKQVYALSRPGHYYLYKDIIKDQHYFWEYDKPGKTDRWLHNGKTVKFPWRIYGNDYPVQIATIKTPNQSRCMGKKKKFFRYGKSTPSLNYDLVFHARKRKEGQTQINWPLKNYAKIAKEIGGTAASVGTHKGACHVPGTEDLRDIELERLCNVFASSKVAVGTSSGPLHLASFCGCSHVVITGAEYRKAIGGNNRYRYEKLWNPLRTKVDVVDKYGWQPPVEAVVKSVEKICG